MKKLRRLAAALLAGALLLNSAVLCPSAAKVRYLTLNGERIARIGDDGMLYLINRGDPNLNSQALNALMKGDTERTVVIPKGNFLLSRGIDMGSNKTINAFKESVIIQTDPQKQLIKNPCKEVNYNSVKNVTINGGTWVIEDNEKMLRDTSTIRFNHGQSILIKNATIYTNYRSHGVELIACKDVKVYNCNIKCEGTVPSNRREEALQIDIAAEKTAPTCADGTGKYVAGQTCRNITIDKCTISGSRALCCNYTSSENGRFKNNMHHNIVVKNCTLTGVRGEGLVLHNVHGFSVKNNTIISNNNDLDTLYSCGINAMIYGTDKDGGTYKNYISGNTVKGGRFAAAIAAKSGVSAVYGPTTITDNKLYSKRGSKFALSVKNVSKLTQSGNKPYSW